MAVTLGHFIYENAGTGCLLSKYCHPGLPAPLSESASLMQPDQNFPDDPFCGQFLATWVESTNPPQPQSALLIITRKRGPGNAVLLDRYTLVWQDLNNPVTRRFNGEGMLYKGMLVGAYR